MGTLFFVTPQYKSSAMFYVNNSDIDIGSTTLSLTASDISASRGLVDLYIVILNTRETLLDVIDYAGADVTYGQLVGMISAEAVNETEVFRVTITHPDPVTADKLADAVAYILPKRIANIVEGTSAKIVESSVVAAGPSSPSYTKNTVVGFLVGVLAMAMFLVVRELMNVTIRTEEDIAQACKHPVLASVPDMEVTSKGGYYYGYGSKKPVEGAPKDGKQSKFIGGNISFAAAEAYKLLRTKLQFSFTDEKACRIIGISSALTGEGKSISALNLAYSLAQLDKRVLLVDCDMRRPTLAERLLYVNTNISVNPNNYLYFGNGVRPVVYLTSSVEIVDGTGSSGDPYILEQTGYSVTSTCGDNCSYIESKTGITEGSSVTISAKSTNGYYDGGTNTLVGVGFNSCSITNTDTGATISYTDSCEQVLVDGGSTYYLDCGITFTMPSAPVTATCNFDVEEISGM